MLLRICLALGVVDPATVTAEQFTLWERFYHQEPFGDERQDLREMASLMNARAHLMPPGHQSPSMAWPYFETEETQADAIQQHQERIKQLRERGLIGG